MAHERKLLSNKEKHEDHVADLDIEDLEISKSKTIYNCVARLMEKIASTRIGQIAIRKIDRGLKVVEDTAKWSLPQDESNLPPERPLPWAIFLCLIVWLRMVRIWVSCISYIMGSQSITPYSMVYFIQIQRRRLRAIRFQGLKTIRNQEIETNIIYDSNKKFVNMEKIQKVFTKVFNTHQRHDGNVPNSEDKIQNCKSVKNSEERSVKRPRCEVIDIQGLTIDKVLDKYNNKKYEYDFSDYDSDYAPVDGEDDDDDDDGDDDESLTSVSSLEEAEVENPAVNKNKQKLTEIFTPVLKSPFEIRKETSKSQKDALLEERSKEDIKTRAEKQHEPESTTLEIHTIADNNNKETPKAKEIPLKSDTSEPAQTLEKKEKEQNTPKNISSFLAVPQVIENETKSTPGHESAASINPSLSAGNKPGSLQDIHSIFHPKPTVKNTAVEAQISTAKAVHNYKSSSNEIPEIMAIGNQKKYFNHSTHSKHKYSRSVKNPNKNRH